MHPPVPKTEGEIATIIDKWREQYDFMRNYDSHWNLPSPFVRAALKSMMIGNAREYFEQLVDKPMPDQELIEKAFDYAQRKRLDHKKLDPDHMDVGAITSGTQDTGADTRAQTNNYEGSATNNYDPNLLDNLLVKAQQLQE